MATVSQRLLLFHTLGCVSECKQMRWQIWV